MLDGTAGRVFKIPDNLDGVGSVGGGYTMNEEIET
jgi:hypothetical protein